MSSGSDCPGTKKIQLGLWSQQATRPGSRDLLVQPVPPATMGVTESLGQAVGGEAGWGRCPPPTAPDCYVDEDLRL